MKLPQHKGKHFVLWSLARLKLKTQPRSLTYPSCCTYQSYKLFNGFQKNLLVTNLCHLHGVYMRMLETKKVKEKNNLMLYFTTSTNYRNIRLWQGKIRNTEQVGCHLIRLCNYVELCVANGITVSLHWPQTMYSNGYFEDHLSTMNTKLPCHSLTMAHISQHGNLYCTK